MLGIVKKDRPKNILAMLSMFGVYAFYFIRISPEGTLESKIWMPIIYSAISIILYVLIGFKLYGRVESLLDKVAPDQEKPRRGKK